MSKPKTIETGFKRIIILLGLLIFSPIIMSLGIKALRVYKENPLNLLAYFLVALGIILIVYTVYYGFKTFKIILDILFNS